MYSTEEKTLNDQSAEYVISVAKHFFNDQIVVQYGIQNTLEDQILSSLKIQINSLDSKSAGLKVSGVVNLPEGV